MKGKSLILALLATLGTAGLSRPSFAQHPIILQRLGEWNAAAPQPSAAVLTGEIERVARPLYPEGASCPKQGIVVDKVEPATADRYVFNGILRGQVKNGWTAIVRHPGCDSAPVRYMIVQEADGSFHTTRVNRGESLAHDSLIGDSFPLAVLQASAVLKRAGTTCDAQPAAARLGIVRVAGKGPGLGPDAYGVRYAGSWSEEWPITLCGRTVLVTVDFTADGDGGAYHRLPGDKAKLLPAATP